MIEAPRSRTCVHCGRVVAADRKLRCNHCGEFFGAPEDRPAIETPGAEGPVVRSGRRVVVGLVVALAIPVSFALLAWLVDRGIAPYDPLKPLLAPLGYISFLELILGPLGLLIAGRGARIRDAIVWLAVFVVGLPALVVLSLFAVVSLSGALGEPF